MYGRWVPGLMIVTWLLAMSWLVATKLLPPMLGGDPPDYTASLVTDADAKAPTTSVWRLRWREQTIGHVMAEIDETDDGITVYSLAKFDKLPLQALLDDLFGALASVMKPWTGNEPQWHVDLAVASRVRYDQQRQLKCFDTRVDLASMPDFLAILGAVNADSELKLEGRLNDGVPSIHSGTPRDNSPPLFSHTIQLPPNALVENGLLPRERLRNLHEGQTWTIPVYRSFPPNAPLQIVQAKVEKLDVIFWNGEDVETFVVVYRADTGSGTQESEEPIGVEWVRQDGTVIRQDVNFSNMRLTFERMPADEINPLAELMADNHARRWQAE